MATKLLTEKYDADLYGVLNCYDRIIIVGHLDPLCYDRGMTRFLYSHKIRIFDYRTLLQPLREILRTCSGSAGNGALPLPN